MSQVTIFQPASEAIDKNCRVCNAEISDNNWSWTCPVCHVSYCDQCSCLCELREELFGSPASV